MNNVEKFIKSNDPINRYYMIVPTEGGLYRLYSKSKKDFLIYNFNAIKKINKNVYMVKSVDKIITILGFNEKSKELKELYECRRIISIYDEFMLVISFYGPKKLVKYSSSSCAPFKSEDGADYVLFLESLTGETDIINTINYEKLGSFKYIHSLDDYNHIGRKANGNYVYINLKEWKASKEYFSMYHFMFGESGVFLVENEERKAALLKAETLEQTRFFDCVVRMNSEFALGTIRDKQVIIKLEDFSEAIF